MSDGFLATAKVQVSEVGVKVIYNATDLNRAPGPAVVTILVVVVEQVVTLHIRAGRTRGQRVLRRHFRLVVRQHTAVLPGRAHRVRPMISKVLGVLPVRIRTRVVLLDRVRGEDAAHVRGQVVHEVLVHIRVPLEVSLVAALLWKDLLLGRSWSGPLELEGGLPAAGDIERAAGGHGVRVVAALRARREAGSEDGRAVVRA